MVINMETHKPIKATSSLAELYPELSAEELLEAKHNLERYIEIVWKMFQRIENDSEEKKRWDELQKEL